MQLSLSLLLILKTEAAILYGANYVAFCMGPIMQLLYVGTIDQLFYVGPIMQLFYVGPIMQLFK